MEFIFYYWKDSLVTVPQLTNPYKLIFKVLNYARSIYNFGELLQIFPSFLPPPFHAISICMPDNILELYYCLQQLKSIW